MKKNILIILCDQLSAQALPEWGNSFTSFPHIQSLIQRGIRFQNAFTNAPLCQPSRASFRTSLYPHQNHVLSNGKLAPVPPLSEKIPTLGSVFAEAGYKTFHCGKQHDSGSLRGFERIPEEEKEIEGATSVWPVNYDTKQDRYTREKIVSFLEKYRGEKPFLAVADFNNPHNICGWVGENQGEHQDKTYEGDLPPLPANYSIKDFHKRPLPIQYLCCSHVRQCQASAWNETNIRHYLLAYYHYLSRVDTEIGFVLNALQERGDSAETLVVFTADHGDSMGGHGMVTKHTGFYEETVHIPLVFAGAGIRRDNPVVRGLASLLDLFPTLCDYAGIPIPPGLSGQSLFPCLATHTGDPPNKMIVSQWHTEWGHTIEPGRMVRTQSFKYTHYLEENGEELYDLECDPGETETLIEHPGYREILEKHRLLLREYSLQTDDPYFDLTWKAEYRWRSHLPGYRNHKGVSAPHA